jgi:disulfide bond formation protein DsbB
MGRRNSLAIWTLLALGLSGIAASGSVYLSVGLGLKACPLCFYQRSFAIAVVAVVTMLCWLDGLRSSRACLVALPLSVGGLGIAVFHVYLVQSGKLECPPGLFGWSDGPTQSLAVFAALTIACVLGTCAAQGAAPRGGWLAIALALIIGVLAAWACIASSPPMPPVPKQPYDPVKQPLDMCRPPFPGA